MWLHKPGSTRLLLPDMGTLLQPCRHLTPLGCCRLPALTKKKKGNTAKWSVPGNAVPRAESPRTAQAQFVTAPMHHAAARARHRHLVSYASAAAPPTGQAATCSPLESASAAPGEQKQHSAEPGIEVGPNADEAEIQAALADCDRQQRLLQQRDGKKQTISVAQPSLNDGTDTAR